MDHLAIPVADHDRSREFYETYLGFGHRPSRRYDDGVLMIYDDRGFALALGPEAPSRGSPRWMHFGRRLPDRDSVLALRERMGAAGFEPLESWDEPGYVSFKVRDPDGYIVEIFWEP